MKRPSNNPDRARVNLIARPDPVLFTIGVVALVTSAFYLADAGSDVVQIRLIRFIHPVLTGTLTLLALRVARTPDMPRANRRFWYAMAISGMFFTIGNLNGAITAIRSPLDALDVATIEAVCQALATVVPLVAMLMHPIALQGRQRKVAFWVDSATVMVGTLVFAWYYMIGIAIGTDGLITSLIASTLLPVAAFAMAKLVIGGSAPMTRSTAVVFLLALLIETPVATLNPMFVNSEYRNELLAMCMLPTYLVACAPRIQQLMLRRGTAYRVRPPRPYSRLPYLAVAMSQGLLLVATLNSPDGFRAGGVVIGVIVITVMVIIRQLAAFGENNRLVGRLDASLTELGHQEQRLRSLVQHATEITLILNAAGEVMYASPALQRVLGVRPEDAIGQSWRPYVHPEDLPGADASAAKLRAVPGSNAVMQIRVRRADGSWCWLEAISTNLIDDPSVGGVICNARDISEARQFQERLRHDATHDSLTTLPNRTLYNERVHASRQRSAAVLLIDLDDFKPVNDKLGHHVGDGLLVAVGERLRGNVRPGDTPARLGGDEFAVLLPDTSPDHALPIAQRIMNALTAEPVMVDGHRLRISASVGLAVGVLDDNGVLLQQADEAMYLAKRSGKGALGFEGRSLWLDNGLLVPTMPTHPGREAAESLTTPSASHR